MTEKEAINEITSKTKFYLYANPPMPQSTASNFLASYRKGMAKKSTINKFLDRFGYKLIQEEQWDKL